MKSWRASGSSMAMGSSRTRSRRPPRQRQGQRELGLLATGQLPGLRFNGMPSSPSRRSAYRWSKWRFRFRGHVQQVGGREVLVQRRVLGHERDAVERGQRPRPPTAEDGNGARARICEADRQVQQGGLAGAVRSDQRGQVPLGDGQRALAQCPRAAIAFPEGVGFDDVHATAFRFAAWRADPRCRQVVACGIGSFRLMCPSLSGPDRPGPWLPVSR